MWRIGSNVFSEAIIPDPVKTFIKISELLIKPDLYMEIGVTLLRSVAGFFAGLLVGSLIGIWIGYIRSFERILFIPIVILQGAPPLLWVVPLMLLVGTDGATPVLIVFFVVLPLVIISLMEGVRAIDKRYYDMFQIYAPRKVNLLKFLIIPKLSPYYKSIFLLGIVLSIKSAIIGEWFGAKNGMGRLINNFFYSFDMISFYAYAIIFIFVISVISVAINHVTGSLSVKRRGVYPDFESGHLTGYFYDKSPSPLDLRGISFSYKTGKKGNVLDNVSFQVPVGTAAVLTGKSGSGKTTLAKIASGVISPAGGEAYLPEKCVMIFQDDLLLDHLDAFNNASLPGIDRNIDNISKVVIDALNMCGISPSAYPDELSGGMKKRLAFARALVANPGFIILDEPFNNLDRVSRMELWELFFKLFTERGIPSLIITHYPEELAGWNVSYYELNNGSLRSISGF